MKYCTEIAGHCVAIEFDFVLSSEEEQELKDTIMDDVIRFLAAHDVREYKQKGNGNG